MGKRDSNKPGFTLVELIIVVAVLAIIASISIIAYGNWRLSIAQKQLRSDLIAAVSAMDGARNNGTQYPATLPNTIDPSDGVALTVVYATQDTFCISGTGNSGTQYFVTESSKVNPQAGTCPGQLTVPGAPTNVSATLPSSSQANFTWTAPSGTVTGYDLQCAADAGYITDVVNVSTVTASGSITGLSANDYLVCHVRAENSVGVGPWSTNYAFVVINAPTSLVATTASSSQVNTSWSAVPGAQSYLLQWSTSSTFATITGSTSGIAGTSSNVTGLSPQGTRYYFRVMAQVATFNGPASVTVNALTTINTPSAPVVTASATGTGTSNSITWSWPAVTCPSGTTVRYSTAIYKDDSTGWRAWSADVTTTTVTQTTTEQGYEYMAKVRARCTNAAANSSYSPDSNEPSFIRDITAPGIATTFVYGTYSTYDIFTWTPPSCQTGTTMQWRGSLYAYYTYNDGLGNVGTGWTSPDIFFNPTNASSAKARWENPATVTSSEIYWPRVDAVNMIVKQYTGSTSPGWNVSWSATNGTYLLARSSRAFVQYRCINTVTNRLAEGTFVVSPMVSKNGGWLCDRNC